MCGGGWKRFLFVDVLGIRRLARNFKSETVFGSISFHLLGNRRVKLINTGKRNGSAFFGVMAKGLVPSRNGVR